MSEGAGTAGRRHVGMPPPAMLSIASSARPHPAEPAAGQPRRVRSVQGSETATGCAQRPLTDAGSAWQAQAGSRRAWGSPPTIDSGPGGTRRGGGAAARHPTRRQRRACAPRVLHPRAAQVRSRAGATTVLWNAAICQRSPARTNTNVDTASCSPAKGPVGARKTLRACTSRTVSLSARAPSSP